MPLEAAVDELPGNFSIEIRPDELVVASEVRRKPFNVIVGSLLILIFVLRLISLTGLHGVLRSTRPVTSTLLILGMVCFCCVAVFQLARVACGSREILRCNRTELELTQVDFGRAWRKRSFAVEAIRDMQFASVAFSQYGDGMGLACMVGGKRVKALRGLTAVGAQRILAELQLLGVAVIVDPGMAMMVEMEVSRRKSWVGRLFC